MVRQKSNRDDTYVDTPQGLFTAAGIWFHATETSIRSYAGPVLEAVPLEKLLRYAEVWLRSPQTLTLWAVPLLLAVLDPLPAVLAAVVLFLGWKVLGPSFTSLLAVRIVAMLDKVWLQSLYYVAALTLLSAVHPMTVVWVGLAVFVVVRWGVLAWLIDPLVRPLQRSLYELPVPDQVLRGFILRVAMKHRLSLPHLDRIEQDILSNWHRKK